MGDWLRKEDLIRLVTKGIEGKTHRYKLLVKRVPEKEVGLIINRLFYEINHALLNKRAVVISNFGKFTVARSKRTLYRNPHTKKIFNMRRKYRVKFKVASNVKKLVGEL